MGGTASGMLIKQQWQAEHIFEADNRRPPGAHALIERGGRGGLEGPPLQPGNAAVKPTNRNRIWKSHFTFFTKCCLFSSSELTLLSCCYCFGRQGSGLDGLKQSKGYNGGWSHVTIAWGLAVMCGAALDRQVPCSGAHTPDPALSIGLAAAGSFPWAFVASSGPTSPLATAGRIHLRRGAGGIVYITRTTSMRPDDPGEQLGVFYHHTLIMDIKPLGTFSLCEFVGTFPH